jgi:Tfp pilus assembly ATPase PilU
MNGIKGVTDVVCDGTCTEDSHGELKHICYSTVKQENSEQNFDGIITLYPVNK